MNMPGMPPSSFLSKVTVHSARAGVWSDPTVWNTGKIPGVGDFVLVENNVLYDLATNVACQVVETSASGYLKWSRTGKTQIGATTFSCPAGTMDLGTDTDPVKAEILFMDQALDLTNDPEQWGHGLIVQGTGILKFCGGEKDAWTLLDLSPRAGDPGLRLANAVIGWQVGDKLFLPDTRGGLRNPTASWSEVATIKSISPDTMTITLAAPLQYAHPSVADPNTKVVYYAPVGNLTRGVVFRSANPLGTRGHFLFTGRATVDDCCHAEFRDMGRTRCGNRDSTLFDAMGNVTHVGTNQIGRYSWHAHHAIGPAVTPASGYQFDCHGLSVWNTVPMVDGEWPAWGASIHNCSWGHLTESVIFRCGERCFTFEDGAEWQNVVEDNLLATCSNIVGVNSSYGLWTLNLQNRIRRNLAADIRGGGFGAYGFYAKMQGGASDKAEPGGGIYYVAEKPGDDPMITPYPIDANAAGVLEFSGNTAFGCGSGFGPYWVGCWSGGRICGRAGMYKDLTILNCAGYGVFNYDQAYCVYDGLVIASDMTDVNLTTEECWEEQDYPMWGRLIENASIAGLSQGLDLSHSSLTNGAVIRNSTISAKVCAVVPMMSVRGPRPANGQFGPAYPRIFLFDTVKFVRPAAVIASVWEAIHLQYNATQGCDITSLMRTFLLNYQGIAGNNFQVFFAQQASDAIMVQTSDPLHNVTGCPVAGLTNAEAFAQYKICTCGQMIPAGPTILAPEIPGGVLVPITMLPADVVAWANNMGA